MFVLGRRKDTLEKAVTSINDAEQRLVAVPVVCDVGDKAALQAAVDTVTAVLDTLPDGNPGVQRDDAGGGRRML